MVRGVLLTGYGGRGKLEVTELPEPAAAPDEVVVKMAFSGLNRLDVFVRQGLAGPGVRSPRVLPHVMGAEGSGVVVAVGDHAPTDLRAGDQVMVFPGLSCGRCRHCHRGQTSRCPEYALLGEDVWGVQRERLSLHPRSLLRVPDGMSLQEAAAVPIAYTTAWTMLVTAGRLRLAERVLVVGGSGGVSVAAIQFATHAGAQVWVTTRGPDKATQLSRLPGVLGVIDSSRPGWHEQVLEATQGDGVDMVIDSVGAPTWRDSIRSLAQGGRMMLCGATGGDQPDISIRELYQSHRQIIGAPFGGWNDFVDVVQALDRTQIRPLIHETVPMDQIQRAHQIIEESTHIGKVLVSIG